MRTLTSFALLAGVASLAIVAGCTVKDVDTPALAGPSTLARQITLVADRDTLTQNGTDFTDIRITALGPDGQSENIPLRAQIFVNGAANDFGTLSTKFPITPTTIRYTAPAASSIAAAATPITVQIAVTPFNNGDFGGELTRFISVNLQPQGIILPTNPNLVAAFTFTPAAPLAGTPTTFDASTSTNGGTACGPLCTYAWNFGDGATAAGIVATHAFSKVGNTTVTLTVTDAFGASAQTSKVVTVGPPTPPTASFTVSPTPPPTNVDIFFNATASRPAAGRTITSYSWEFGDGTGGSGAIVTHKYTGVGSFVVVLTVRDDAGAETQFTQTLPVGTSAAEPSASFTTTISGRTVTVDGSASKPGTGATITNYKYDYGDGNFENVPNPIQSHTYAVSGVYIVLLEITDSNGKKAATTKQITIP
jgi:PKD repeat protein